MLPYIITALVAALVGVGIAFPLGVKHRKKIAEQKMPDLNCSTVESAMNMVMGQARSMGIEVVE